MRRHRRICFDRLSTSHAVLEATGPYHEIAAEALFDAACKVSVVNPAYTKSFAQSLGVTLRQAQGK